MDVTERTLWSHQPDDKKADLSKSGKVAVDIDNKPVANNLTNLLSRLYFVVPFLILGSILAVELIINGVIDLTLPNILIVLASIMCLVTWSMKINSELTNLMPVVITAISGTALAMLMVSETPNLHMHAAASMMVMIVWLTSAPKINIYVQSISAALIIFSLSYILITASLSTQNVITVFVLLISGVMMGGFTQFHRYLHAKDNIPEDLLNGDLSNVVYDEEEEGLFEESHESDLDQDWPVVLEKLSKSLNSIHDVDVLFNKMLLALHESIPYKSAVVGMLQGRDLKIIQSYGEEELLTAESVEWSNSFIRNLADKQQEFTNKCTINGAEYYRLDLPIISNNKFIGVVTLVRDNEEFGNYACKLSSSILFHSMVSLRNARLYEEFKKLKSKGKQTALVTRDQFMDLSSQKLERLNDPRSASLMIVEIDHFEKLEERYKKETSLSVYNSITEVLLSATRDNDILGRYGKDGYIILLNDTDLLEAKKQAERVRALIEKTPCKTSVGKITTTVSIGLSSASHSDEDIESLAQRSGMALFVAKESGMNSVKVKL